MRVVGWVLVRDYIEGGDSSMKKQQDKTRLLTAIIQLLRAITQLIKELIN